MKTRVPSNSCLHQSDRLARLVNQEREEPILSLFTRCLPACGQRPYLHDGPTPLQGFEARERKVESVRDVKEGLPFAFRSIGVERRDELRVVGQPIGEIGVEPGI